MSDYLNRPRGLYQTIPHTFRLAPELAAAVDRAAYLADDLDREAADLRRNAPVVADGIADIKSRAAARIRAALEGAEE